MAISTLPDPPSRQDPDNFASKGDAFLGALPTFQAEANQLAIDVNSNATAAENSKTESEFAASQSIAAANHKGSWSNLTGPLNIPASVSHSGNTYLLLNNLANVTSSEPGITADWDLIGGSFDSLSGDLNLNGYDVPVSQTQLEMMQAISLCF